MKTIEEKAYEESEDKRIKKCITLLVNGLTSEHFVRCGASLDEIRAWLEKQDKHTKFTEKQDDTKFRKYIEVASNVLVKLLESDKFKKDVREHLFDKGDNDLSSIYDIYAKETIKYVKALFKQIENEY